MTVRRLAAVFAGILTAGLLAGCAVLQGPAPALYTLNPPRAASAAAKVGWQLSVEDPASSGALDSPRVMAIRNRTAVEPFAEVSWTDRAPAMLGSLIVEAFENSGAVPSVGRDAVGLRADFLLKTELRDFQAEYDGASTGLPQRVRVRLVAKLVAMPRRVVEASETFEAMVPVSGTGFPAVIAAFDRATGDVLTRLVDWTLASGRAMQAPEKKG
jgi:cholesterol transport system auxiliary component